MQDSADTPWSFRMLAPGGEFSSACDILRAWQEIRQTIKSAPGSEAATVRSIAARLAGENLGQTKTCFYSSGKAALQSLFSQLKNHFGCTTLLLGAFTCPDIASAAFRAGLQVQPVDTHPETLEPNFRPHLTNFIPSETIILLSNLYGLLDSPRNFGAEVFENGFHVVDDMCQSGLSVRRDEWSEKCWRVYSFARGKAFAGVGGGAIAAPENYGEYLAYENVFNALEGNSLPQIGGFRNAYQAVLASLLSVLENPYFYSLLSRIPALELGVTRVKSDFPVAEISTIELLVAYSQMKRCKAVREIFLKNSKVWADVLCNVNCKQPYHARVQASQNELVPIRYPILLSSKLMADVASRQLSRSGLGASRSYAKTLYDFPSLPCRGTLSDVPGAREVSECILTLPVHRYVSDVVRGETVQLLEKCLHAEGGNNA